MSQHNHGAERELALSSVQIFGEVPRHLWPDVAGYLARLGVDTVHVVPVTEGEEEPYVVDATPYRPGYVEWIVDEKGRTHPVITRGNLEAHAFHLESGTRELTNARRAINAFSRVLASPEHRLGMWSFLRVVPSTGNFAFRAEKFPQFLRAINLKGKSGIRVTNYGPEGAAFMGDFAEQLVISDEELQG
jgi:hypothetical protein